MLTYAALPLLLVFGWWWIFWRDVRSPAYQKRFAKLSPEDLNRLVDGMKRPLNRGPEPEPTVDMTKWRLEVILKLFDAYRSSLVLSIRVLMDNKFGVIMRKMHLLRKRRVKSIILASHCQRFADALLMSKFSII